MELTFKLTLLFCFITLSLSQVSILSPLSVVNKLSVVSNNKITYKFGNFGDIPYGKTQIGRVFYHKQEDGSNYWCDYEKTSTPKELENNDIKEYTPIFLVDHSTGCNYTQKAKNVSERGGRIMLWVSDLNTLNDEYNVDDQLGDTVDIPTVIITKNVGEILKESLSENTSEHVILAIKFTGVLKTGMVNIELFFRSDDMKALNFFNEFDYYKNKLGDNLNFTPIYKYNIYFNEETSNSISSTVTAPCIKSTHYCASKNPELKITNPRIILWENIRQSCIFGLGLDPYWEYMKSFSSLCADINNPTFNEDCALNAMKDSGWWNEWENVENCMVDTIEAKGKVEHDYNWFNKKKIYMVPELLINGVKYRGSWYSKVVFSAICNGFFENEEICSTPVELPNSVGGMKYILYLGVGAFVLMLFLLCCYRRIVNRSLESSLNDRIQEQALRTIEQYKVFKGVMEILRIENLLLINWNLSLKSEKKLD